MSRRGGQTLKKEDVLAITINQIRRGGYEQVACDVGIGCADGTVIIIGGVSSGWKSRSDLIQVGRFR